MGKRQIILYIMTANFLAVAYIADTLPFRLDILLKKLAK